MYSFLFLSSCTWLVR